MLKFLHCKKQINCHLSAKMIQLQYTNPTTGHRPVLPIVKRDIPPGFSVSAKEYRPTMHPKCAAALADKDGKKKLMLKGRTEVTASKREDLHKKEAAEMRSRIVFCTSAFGIRPLAALFLGTPIIRVRPCSIE